MCRKTFFCLFVLKLCTIFLLNSLPWMGVHATVYLLSTSSIRAKLEVSRSNGSRATAPPTDASDNLISPIGWAKNLAYLFGLYENS
jgi:hypothetical protein